MRSKIFASDRNEWRNWLAENHDSAEEVWLVYFKKHTGKASVSYMESVKEALCFGWIDGIKKSIDNETYMHRFTPRRPRSKWSPLNIKLAKELIDSGQMTGAGLAVFKQRQEYDPELLKSIKAQDVSLAPEIKKSLKANQKAWENFNQLAPGYRKQYVGWLQSAKRPETREKRLKEAIELLARNKKLGMK